MKKYLLLAIAALFVLPITTSCGGPSGKPKKDAESYDDIIKKQCEVELELREKNLEMLEYYAEKKDAKTYDELQVALKDVNNDVRYEFEKEHRDKIREIEKREEEAKKKLNNQSSTSK